MAYEKFANTDYKFTKFSHLALIANHIKQVDKGYFPHLLLNHAQISSQKRKIELLIPFLRGQLAVLPCMNC